MKKLVFFFIFLFATLNVRAQYFLGTISSVGTTLHFKVRPTGGDMTTAIGYFEFCIRYTATTNITFSNLTANTANTVTASGFPGLSIAESTERSFGGYKYKRFVATVSIPSQTYRNNTEYKVCEVKLSSAANPLDIQLVTDYESLVPNDFYFVVSTGAGDPLVDVTGVNNFYPTQSQTGTTQYFSLMNIVLPIELLSFQGEQTKAGNLLTWLTASEKNVANFDIERSVDGKIFEKIGLVKATNAASSSHQAYTFTDTHFGKLAANILYYRLKINDLDGTNHYSKTITLERNKTLTLNVYPNPAKQTLHVEGLEANGEWQVVDILGKVQATYKGQREIDIRALSDGIYFIKTANGRTTKFIIPK